MASQLPQPQLFYLHSQQMASQLYNNSSYFTCNRCHLSYNTPHLFLSVYSRTSLNGPSEKRTTSLQRTLPVIRIEIKYVVPPSGRFRIPESGHDSRSQPHFSVQKVSLSSGHQETTPSKLAFTSPALRWLRFAPAVRLHARASNANKAR